MQPIYVGELGMILGVSGNAALSMMLITGAPWQMMALAALTAVVGIFLGVWALVSEDTDPARMWERAARKAERRANRYLSRGMPGHAERELKAAGVARSRATQIKAIAGDRSIGSREGARNG